MEELTQNTTDGYLWRNLPNTPTTIIHGGTHPKHQRLLSMVELTQNINNYYPWWHPPKTPTIIIHGDNSR
jgi:hypothetical protein